MRILVFPTEAEARTAVVVIDALAARWWAARGYRIVLRRTGYTLVGRRADTGEDAPMAAQTRTWAEPEPAPDGLGWWIPSPSVATRWDGWQAIYASMGGPAYVERTWPAAWDLLLGT